MFELLVPDDDLLQLIAQNASLHQILEKLAMSGFQTLRSDGMSKVRGGMTTVEEVLKVTVT